MRPSFRVRRNLRGRSILLALPLIVASLSCDGTPSGTSATRPGVSRAGVSEVDAIPEDKIASGQTLYVPIYSHVYTADNAQPLNLAATLFVRNIDPRWPIILTRVQYFDSSGKAIRAFLSKPLKIEPLASMDYFVKESDETGGASPSFIVEWVSPEPVANPVVESVMIGTAGTQGISFTCTSRVLTTRKP